VTFATVTPAFLWYKVNYGVIIACYLTKTNEEVRKPFQTGWAEVVGKLINFNTTKCGIIFYWNFLK